MKQAVAVQRLQVEREKLLNSINRNKQSEDEIILEHTEDEGDLAVANHGKELAKQIEGVNNKRLLGINHALVRARKGEHNDCEECGSLIGDKRLDAVPWATLCVSCQSQREVEQDVRNNRAIGAYAQFEEA